MKITKLILAMIVAGFIIDTNSEASARDIQPDNRMFPKANDLSVQIKDCPIRVVEWKSSKHNLNSGPSKNGFILLSLVCKKVINKFPVFIKSKNLKMSNPGVTFKADISFLPWDPEKDGEERRNLNDTTFRFSDRTKFYDSDNNELGLLGFTNRDYNYIAMMNDIFLPPEMNNKNGVPIPNKVFARVFAHEMFHSMSEQYGVFDNLSPKKHKRYDIDEKLARNFTAFIGLGE